MYKFEYKNEYKHIVSFGCMCSMAIFLRKYGFRDSSYFFDWLTSDFFGNLKLVKNDFADAANPLFFKQEYSEYPHLVTNVKYNFIYTHVFDVKRTFTQQSSDFFSYVNKRIDNFKKIAFKDTLLLYYCRDIEEQKKIEKSTDEILEFVNNYGYDIAFIFNNSVSLDFPFMSFVIPYNNTHYPIGGGVSFPFESGDTEKLFLWLNSVYDENIKKNNLKFKTRRSILKIIAKKLRTRKKDVLVF